MDPYSGRGRVGLRPHKATQVAPGSVRGREGPAAPDRPGSALLFRELVKAMRARPTASQPITMLHSTMLREARRERNHEQADDDSAGSDSEADAKLAAGHLVGTRQVGLGEAHAQASEGDHAAGEDEGESRHVGQRMSMFLPRNGPTTVMTPRTTQASLGAPDWGRPRRTARQLALRPWRA